MFNAGRASLNELDWTELNLLTEVKVNDFITSHYVLKREKHR